MNANQVHRGPDSGGYYVSEADRFGLGSRRLRIIDLDGSDQPIFNEDRSLVVVHNGEILNFPELRQELQAAGHRFQTEGDTEVIVHAHEEWGDMAPRRFRGMFAYALWDMRRKRLLLVRDQVGIKPLHYYLDGNGTLAFASEIKSLLLHPDVPRRLDLQACHDTLNLRYVQGTRTLFDGIRRLPAGHILVASDGAVEIKEYWRWDTSINTSLSPEEWAEGIRDRLATAVKRALVTDVPLGLYLSGGMDSSSILAAARMVTSGPLTTFTVAFNEPTDEHEDAARVARHFGAEHKVIRVRPDLLADLPLTLFHVEEPKVNQLQGLILARAARRLVKVALSGIGGDELFGGYVHYRFLGLGDHLRRLPLPWTTDGGIAAAHWLSRVQMKPGLERWDEYRRAMQMALGVKKPEIFYGISRNAWDWVPVAFDMIAGPALREAGVRPSLRHYAAAFTDDGRTMVERGMAAEFGIKLRDDFLVNEDRTSMAVSLEVRPALLDADLAAFILRMPGKHRIDSLLNLRPLFRTAMSRDLPGFTLAKKKWGFAVNPVEQWKKDLRDVARSILTRDRVEGLGVVRWDYVSRILDAPAHPRLRWHLGFIWLVMALHLWHEIFFAAEPPRVGDDFRLERFI